MPGQVTINLDNWKVLVGKATGKKWNDFTITTWYMVEHTCEFLNKLKVRKIPVRYIFHDPTGDNQKLVKCKESKDGVILQPLGFEFTSQDTM